MSLWQALPKPEFCVQLTQEYGTPLYIYDAESIKNNFLAYQGADCISYAVKANSNINILRYLNDLGAAFDIVSIGELERVLVAGGSASKVIFSGVAKTDAEIRRALEAGIACFNVESAPELEIIARIAEEMNLVAPISLRVNPEVDAQTHPYISTGMKENKFGVALDLVLDLYRWAYKNKNLKIKGISCHIGSQITKTNVFLEALECLINLAEALQEEGIKIEYLDVGGGLGVQMQENQTVPSAQELIPLLRKRLQTLPYALHVQPGRSIVANTAFLLSEVVLNKTQNGRNFLMIDAAMNDYMRPSLYQAQPVIKNISRLINKVEALPSGATPQVVADVAGPICASSGATPQIVTDVAGSVCASSGATPKIVADVAGPICASSGATPKIVADVAGPICASSGATPKIVADVAGPICASSGATPQIVADVVGPICESGDTFIKNYPLEALRGEIIAIAGVGAYGMSMASNYNTRPRAAEVLINNGEALLIRKREQLAQLWENEL